MRYSRARPGSQISLPLFSMPVMAGRPTAADDNVEQTLDIAHLLIKRPDSTFFVRVEGESMTDAQIQPNDILIVDRSLEAHHKDVVIAIVDGEFTVKVLYLKPQLHLVSRTPGKPICIDEPFQVWGVVLWVVHKAR